MRSDSLHPLGLSLLLVFAVLTNGCASLTPPPGSGRNLGYTPRGASGPTLEEGLGEQPPRAWASPPDSLPEPEARERLHRRQELREEVTRVHPGSAAGARGDALPRGAAEPGAPSAARARQTVLEAVADAKGSTDTISSSLSRLAARPPGWRNRGLTGQNGIFTRYLDYGSRQLPWLEGALAGTATLADVAGQLDDPDMELALLRLTGPRLQAAMSGALLLTAWLDFLQLADTVLRQCPAYSIEKLFIDLDRVRRLIEPTLAALASGDPARIEAAATSMPKLMGQLTGEFSDTRDGARTAMERAGKFMVAAQFVEMVTMISLMKFSLPRLPPAAPAPLGVGLVMGSGGVMMGSRLVVSAEWVERMRQLVQAGILSLPAVSAAVRIHAGQVLMAHGDLPKGVREALGEGPEVSGMHETGKAGAGMAERPKHHVLPEEHREWFEKRGFTGDMDIDEFCVRLEQSHHQAVHGGGNWRLGRIWPREWNQLIMHDLRKAETAAGRMLTRNEVLRLVAKNMKNYKIPMKFTPWRGR